MNIKDQVTKMDTLVSRGAIVDAVSTFFTDNANTSDYSDATTANKSEMIQKWKASQILLPKSIE